MKCEVTNCHRTDDIKLVTVIYDDVPANPFGAVPYDSDTLGMCEGHRNEARGHNYTVEVA